MPNKPAQSNSIYLITSLTLHTSSLSFLLILAFTMQNSFTLGAALLSALVAHVAASPAIIHKRDAKLSSGLPAVPDVAGLVPGVDSLPAVPDVGGLVPGAGGLPAVGRAGGLPGVQDVTDAVRGLVPVKILGKRDPQLSLPPLIPAIPGVTEPLAENAIPLPILQIPTPPLESPPFEVQNIKPKKIGYFWTGAGDNKHKDFLATVSLDDVSINPVLNMAETNIW